jgi:hypothetical protein
MYILYRKSRHDIDPRFRFLDQQYGLCLVEVTNSEWIDWTEGDPVIVPNDVAERYNDFGRPEYKAYRDNYGNEFPTKMGLEGETVKVKRPYTTEEVKASLEYMKIFMIARVKSIFQERFEKLQKTSNTLESSTWTQQRKEAEAGGGSLLRALANQRHITEEALVAKVIAKAEAYDTAVGDLLGQQQKHIDDIKRCVDIRSAAHVADQKFGIMPHPDFHPYKNGDFRIHI